MKEELKVVDKNSTRELVNMSDKRDIYVKWVYKLKLGPNGEVGKYKARLVARGFHKTMELISMKYILH